jgi:(p)ppGpp synthase/HD superfamily hydrolase
MILTSRFEDALTYALHLHANQFRKGSQVPYFSHLISTAALVMEHGGDEDLVIAALLHDSAEDQGGRETLRAIRERFGERVARIVAECSDTMEIPKPPWRARKMAYLNHLQNADYDVYMVSAADKIHNIRTICTDYRNYGERFWDRFQGGKEGMLWYLGELLKVYKTNFKHPMCDEFEWQYNHLTDLIHQNNRS